MRTQELTGDDLDLAVAKALGLQVDKDGKRYWRRVFDELDDFPIPNYAIDPEAAMPIIEREFICLNGDDGAPGMPASWTASIFDDGEIKAYGPTAQIAAMRCFVASRLGDEVTLE